VRRALRLKTALFLMCALVLLQSVPAAAATAPDGQPGAVAPQPCFNLDLSTGTTQPFVTDAAGTLDPDWWVTSSPDPSLTVPGPVYSITPVPSWYTTGGANWVDPYNTGYAKDANGYYTGMDPAGDYVFANTFNLNGALYTNFVLNVGVYGADNRVELFLDGNATPLGPPAGFGPPNSTAVQGPLSVPIGPGPHTLEARVRNDSGWMGLLVHARITAECRPDLAIVKKPTGEFVAGQNGSYVLSVSNVGLGPTTTSITVTDTLPAGATFISASGAGWTCSNVGTNVTCTNPGPVASGQSLPPITITMTVPFGVVAVQNCASVDTTGDANAENNRGCVESPVDLGRPGAICGLKFHDLNGNGVQDGGEQGLGNWTIRIKDAAGNVVATVTTGQDGTYCFKGLKPGTYVVSEVLINGWNQTYPLSPGTHTITIASGQIVQGINFGNRAKPQENCCLTFRFPSGRPDQFSTANGAEPADPSSGLQQWVALHTTSPLVGFDGTGFDQFFATTVVLPKGNCINSAVLTVRVKPNGAGSTVANDSITLMFVGSNGLQVPATPSWGAHFGLGLPNNLLPNPWSTANYAAGQTFSLNLASLPGGGNLIGALNSLRYLDVAIQDDSSVDYMVLTVKFCECGAVDHAPADPKSQDASAGADGAV